MICTEASHGGLLDDVIVDAAVAEQPLGEEAEDESGDSESRHRPSRTLLDLLKLVLVHAEVVEIAHLLTVLRDESFPLAALAFALALTHRFK